jgi:signal transduction histidine kinase/phage gp46-like protein
VKGLSLRSVRARLWAALTLLSVAVLSVSAVTWFALQRVDSRLQALHQETLSQVAQALDLSKRSSDLATSAPFLLNQRSNFLIEQEGAKLITVLDRVHEDWPQTQFGDARDDRSAVVVILDSMATGVSDLVTASTRLDDIQAAIRVQTAKLGRLRNHVSGAIVAQDIDDATRLIWWSLQSMNADALNAAYAGNLIGVGEEQRHYLRQQQTLEAQVLNARQTDFLATLEEAVWGLSGVFELRRQELASNLNAQNALFRIRQDANRINDVASIYADRAEVFLANERAASSRTIRATRISVAVISLVSLALAMTAAIYVSRYVTFNISRVSSAMVRLANGDHASVLPRRLGGEDEIGDLFRSFRSFRANALRLDRSNRQLDQRNALFEKVFVNISDGIAITDATGRITARNPAFSRIIRFPEAARGGGPFVDWLRDSRFGTAAVQNDLKHDHRGFCELVSEDGQVLEIRASKLPDDGRVWLVADVTERRKMSDRFQQIDRIETLGKVAGDTAHDFANILSTIRTHAHLLEVHQSDRSNGSLEAIGNAVDFGASLTDRLLAFARKQSLLPELVDLNALIGGMTDLVEISLKPGVSLNVTLTPTPLYVLADPGQLESALFNLLLNANTAIDETGSINVSLEHRDPAQARIFIEDDGIGMSDDVLAHAIEPFFTTRADSGGTGLGLSIVYGFIRQTGGNLNIESAVGRGTQIEITLPQAQTVAQPMSIATGKTVLLVEDDPKTRTDVQKMLSMLGYVVTAQATGPGGLSLLAGRHFDLLISDLDLGGEVDGLELVRSAHKSSPATKTVIMSGKSAAKDTVQKHTVFLQKPITKPMLASALRDL